MVKKILYSLFIFVLAFAFRAYTVPHRHQVYYDEFTSFNIAENRSNLGIFYSTAVGSKDHLEVAEATIRPNGYPFLLSVVFGLLGEGSEEAVFRINILLGSLCVVLIFWITYLVFNGDLNVSFWSTVVFGLLPVHLRYSASGNVDIASLFFVLLSVFFALLYSKVKKVFVLYLSVSVAVWAAYIKPENVVLCLLFFVLIPVFVADKKIRTREAILSVAIVGALLSPVLMRFPYMATVEQLSARGDFLSLAYLRDNVSANLRYLFDWRFHSMVSSVFFVLGVVILFFREKKKCLLLFGLFLILFLAVSLYFCGKFSLVHYANSDRYFFVLAIPFSVLSGYGISALLNRTHWRLVWAVLILNMLIVNSALATERIVNEVLGRYAYKEYIYLKESADQIPDDLYVLTYNSPFVVTVMDKRVMNIDIFRSMENLPSKIVLFKDFWWFENTDKTSRDEEFLKTRYHFRVISERWIEGHRYGFYFLTLKS